VKRTSYILEGKQFNHVRKYEIYACEFRIDPDVLVMVTSSSAKSDAMEQNLSGHRTGTIPFSKIM
jgi:hypothetical protein